jgi:hypothetical protein
MSAHTQNRDTVLNSKTAGVSEGEAQNAAAALIALSTDELLNNAQKGEALMLGRELHALPTVMARREELMSKAVAFVERRTT